VLCNVSPLVGSITGELLAAGPVQVPAVVLLVQDAELWRAHPAWHPASRWSERTIVLGGCALDERCFARAGLARARAALILADPRQGELADARSTLLAMAIERSSPDVHTVVELQWSVNRAHLEATDVDEMVCMGDLSEKLIAQSCITPGVLRVFDKLLGVGGSTAHFALPPLPASCTGMSYRQVALRAHEHRWPGIVCGFVQGARGDHPPRLVLNPRPQQEPGKDSVLQAGDRLIVLGRDEVHLPS
jgi:Trk K+ transport system NAD-binding subunit